MNKVEVFLNGALVAAAGAIVVGIVQMIRTLTAMIHDNKSRGADIRAIAMVQLPMLDGIKASLEAVRDGECNGNVSDAHAAISSASIEYQKYLAGRI